MLLNEIHAPIACINSEKYLHQAVRYGDFDKLIRTSCKVNLEGNLPIVYIANVGPEMAELLPHLQSLQYSASQRFNLGRNNKSILFGAVPPSINKSNFCTYGAVADQNDTLHLLLTKKYSTYLQMIMEYYLPGYSQVWNQLYLRKKIHQDYRMANSIWTSGIINLNSPHNYHFDVMNVDKMISAMMTFKSGVEGGYLCFPEYRIAFEVANHSAIFFSGKHVMHGVTPMTCDEDGCRTSIVYYTTDLLTRCDSYNDEILKAVKQ